MSSITDEFEFTDKGNDRLFISDHLNGDGISISTSNKNKNDGMPIAIVCLNKQETIKLRDWLNRKYPR